MEAWIKALYEKALTSNNLGIDIKTQITLDKEKITMAIAAVPMLQYENLTNFIHTVLGQKVDNIIVNGTGNYTLHSAVADCGITGRKLACDFYSAASPIGGGSPWTKDASKADLTLNLYARWLAMENLADNDEVWVYLSSCIGKSCLPSATLKWRKSDKYGEKELQVEAKPSVLIEKFRLNKPIYAAMCRNGLIYI